MAIAAMAAALSTLACDFGPLAKKKAYVLLSEAAGNQRRGPFLATQGAERPQEGNPVLCLELDGRTLGPFMGQA